MNNFDFAILWLPCLLICMLTTAVNIYMNLDGKSEYSGTFSAVSVGFAMLSLTGYAMLVRGWVVRGDTRALYDVVYRAGIGHFAIYFLLFAVNIFIALRKERIDNKRR